MARRFAFIIPIARGAVVLNVAVLHHNKILIAAVFLWMRYPLQTNMIFCVWKAKCFGYFLRLSNSKGKPIKSNVFSCVGIWRNCFGC